LSVSFSTSRVVSWMLLLMWFCSSIPDCMIWPRFKNNRIPSQKRDKAHNQGIEKSFTWITQRGSMNLCDVQISMNLVNINADESSTLVSSKTLAKLLYNYNFFYKYTQCFFFWMVIHLIW
jgi:hypothetical protein